MTHRATPHSAARASAQRRVFLDSNSGALRSAVGVENVTVSRPGAGGRLVRGRVRAQTFHVCCGDPGLSVVLVSLLDSMVVEGTIIVRGNRGMLP